MHPKVPPESTLPSSNRHLFQTISPALAAALISARQLDYSHCTLNENGRDVTFFFDDPGRAGETLLQKYALGQFPLVDPRAFTEARTFLAKENLRLKEGASAKNL